VHASIPKLAPTNAATAAAEVAAEHATRLVLLIRLVDFRDLDVPPVGESSALATPPWPPSTPSLRADAASAH
jgi:hypothetical protein